LFILTHSLRVLNFSGCVGSDVGLGGNVKSHLMASCVRQIVSKNYWNCFIFSSYKWKCRGCFLLGHSV